MIAVLSLLLVATLFIRAARVASIALVGRGMATETARFQARSALMGVGYTTIEAEDVINHPVRRRIILWLMTFGDRHAGLAGEIAHEQAVVEHSDLIEEQHDSHG